MTDPLHQTTMDRAFRYLLLRPVHDAVEAPLHVIAQMRYNGWVEADVLPPHRHGKKIWTERRWHLTDAGRREAQRRLAP